MTLESDALKVKQVAEQFANMKVDRAQVTWLDGLSIDSMARDVNDAFWDGKAQCRVESTESLSTSNELQNIFMSNFLLALGTHDDKIAIENIETNRGLLDRDQIIGYKYDANHGVGAGLKEIPRGRSGFTYVEKNGQTIITSVTVATKIEGVSLVLSGPGITAKDKDLRNYGKIEATLLFYIDQNQQA